MSELREYLKILSTFNVTTREQVSENNQAIFDNLNKTLGFVLIKHPLFRNKEKT